MVSRNRDRVEPRDVARAPLIVGHQRIAGACGNDPLSVILLENVGLHRAASCSHRSGRRRRRVEREHDAGRRVNGHRRCRPQRDAVEQPLHALERVDRHALPAHLAQRVRVIAVEPHERGNIERGTQPGLPLFKQNEAFIGFLARASRRTAASSTAAPDTSSRRHRGCCAIPRREVTDLSVLPRRAPACRLPAPDVI